MFAKARYAITQTLLLSALITQTATAQQTVVGSTPAEFDVSGGQASYSIPIQVAPGRGGMQPDLSLNYTGGGNGPLGVGWNLGGVSSIHRCAATLDQDGFIAGITFTSKDRYCLDGQRLIPVNGTHGAVGAEYRTEVDGYSKIISYGGTANNPSYWVAQTKAGQVVTFGGGNASLAIPQGVTRWSVQQINDSTENNPIIYQYLFDNGSQYLDQVSYIGGKVDFTYETRPDIHSSYLYGNTITINKRLSTISLFSSSKLNNTINLNYQNIGTAKNSRVNIISLCDTQNNCLADQAFSWSLDLGWNPTLEIKTRVSSVGNYASTTRPNMIDVNGDGLIDVVWTEHATESQTFGLIARVALSLGNGSFGPEIKTTISSVGNYASSTQAHFSDVNGDSLLDIVWTEHATGSQTFGLIARVALNEGNGRFSNEIRTHIAGRGNYASTAKAHISDVNGDGLSDIVWTEHATGSQKFGLITRVALSEGDGRFSNEIRTYVSDVGNYTSTTKAHMVDVNGDALLDVVWTEHATGSQTFGLIARVALSLGNGRFSNEIKTRISNRGNYASSTKVHTADVNGDALLDIVWTEHATGSQTFGLITRVGLNQGNGRFSQEVKTRVSMVGNYASSTQANMSDINADGLPDVVWTEHATGSQTFGLISRVALSEGDGSFGNEIKTNVSQVGNYASSTRSHIADVNGDNLPDIIWTEHATGGQTFGLVSRVSLNFGNGNFSNEVKRYISSRGNYASSTQSHIADVDGDGLSDIVWTEHATGSQSFGLITRAALNKGSSPGKLTRIIQSEKNTINIIHKPLADKSVYTKGTGAQYPVVDIIPPAYVVSSVSSSDGVGGTSTVNYHYEGLKYHTRGRGSYGYAKITATYPDTDKTLATYYNQSDFPLTGYVDRVVEKYKGQTVNESHSTYSTSQSGDVHQVHLVQSVDKSYELNGDLITTVTTQNSDVDSFGNIGTVSVSTSANNPVTGTAETFTKTTTSTYTNDPFNWYLGRLTEAVVTHSAPGQANQQRRSVFTYDNATGLLNTESVVSTVTGEPLTTTTYTYDAYGQKTQVRTSAADEADRVSTTTYSVDGKPTQTCNALGQCETYTYTPQGWLASSTGPNSITTNWEYDGFGRKTKEVRADSTETTIAHHFANPSSGQGQCGVLASHAYSCMVTQTTGSQPATVQYDSLGREIRKIATGFDGRLIYSDTQYNNQAQVTRVSRNYFMGDQIYWANSEYDALNRVVMMDEPAPHGARNVITTDYNGLVTTVTSGPEAREKVTYTNAMGQVIRRTEEEGSYLDYTYQADGNLKTTTVADKAETTITLTYDEFGRKISMDDPDMGRWFYSYNAFGQLARQTDAKGQVTTMVYDVLGRMISRTDLAGTANAQTSTWAYGDHTAPLGSIGKLLSTTDGTITKTYFYDALGRPEEANTSIDGANSFTTQTLYDTLGRVSRTIYPGSDNFYTENRYNANGFLEQVRGLRSNSEAYDLSQLTPLVSDAINLAADYQVQANELTALGEFYETKIAHYQALIAAGTTGGALDSALQSHLTQHQATLNQQVADADFDDGITPIFGTDSSDYLMGNSGNDHIYSGGNAVGIETVRGNGGQDALIFVGEDVFPANAANDTNGHWRIRDFVIGNIQSNTNADILSIGRLINQPGLNAHNIGNYLHVVSNPYGYGSRTGLFVNVDGDFTAADRQALDANVVAGGHGADLYLEFQGYAGANDFSVLTGYADNTVAQFQTLIDWGFLDLSDTVPLAQDNGNTFYGHLNNTLIELENVNALINAQIQTYQDTVEQLIVLAEQTLAAADNSFQYERTLLRGGASYTQLMNDADYTNYWTALDVDASGRISAEVYGNGITNDYTYNQATGQLQHIHSGLLVVDPIRHLEYQYDAYQNVTSRHDHVNDLRETYEYDRLDRLTRTDITSSTYTSDAFNGAQTQTYDVLGNITHKSDVGSYTYGENGAGIHAVTTAGGNHYQYDANGNMTHGDGRSVTWSSFNKPTLITRGDNSAAFSYGPDRARYKKVNHNGDTTLYIGKLYEHVTRGSGASQTTDEKHYIYANGQLVAQHIVSTEHGVQTRYLHKDALGSVDLITDAHANVVDRRSFDAWGKLRNLTWKDNEGINNPLYLTQLPFTNKGFTGHEHIQEVGLIHMNGRVYDATLARFMSADPHIQAGALTQSYNRYAYVLNNPLKYTDPSGYFWKKAFRAITRAIRRVTRTVKKHIKKVAKVALAPVKLAKKALKEIAKVPVLNTIANIAACTFGGPLGCAAFAAASTYAVTGSLTAAFKTGLITLGTAFASSYIKANFATRFTRAIGHGVVGGTSSVIQGGKFGQGFGSSFFTKMVSGNMKGFSEGIAGGANAVSRMIGAAGAALVGGTASVLGGGKFANGAQTAAIQYLFNEVGPGKKADPLKVASGATQAVLGTGSMIAGAGATMFCIMTAGVGCAVLAVGATALAAVATIDGVITANNELKGRSDLTVMQRIGQALNGESGRKAGQVLENGTSVLSLGKGAGKAANMLDGVSPPSITDSIDFGNTLYQQTQSNK